MRPTLRTCLVAGALLLVGAAPGLAELTVETYVELTIARLELVETAWRETGAPPAEEEIDELYDSYGTDREAYFCFSGENKRALKAYLDKHPELRDEIESLSGAIRRTIAEGESR